MPEKIIQILRGLDTLANFSDKGDNFCDYLFSACSSSPYEKGSPLKGGANSLQKGSKSVLSVDSP